MGRTLSDSWRFTVTRMHRYGPGAARGASLLAILIGIAILLLLLFFGLRALLSTGGSSTGGSRAAATQLTWITKPESFPKNTPTTFEVELQRMNGATSRWDPYGDQETLVGVVTPASVIIESINGDPPAAAKAIPDNIPGLPGGGTAHPIQTTTTGRIVFVLNGSEAADGKMYVIFVRADGNHTVSEVLFSVMD